MKYLDYREQKQQGTYEFPLEFYHLEPGDCRYQMPYHWHPEYELIRIKKGSFKLTVDGRLYSAKKENILFVHAGVLHGGVPDKCVYECVVFDMKLLMGGNHICNKWIKGLIRNEIRIPFILSGIDRRITRTACELFTILENKKKGYEFMAQGVLYQLFGLLYRTDNYHTVEEKRTGAAIYIERLKEVITYIESHYTEAVTLEDMARVAGLNPRYFCRFFKKLTDRTPIEYLNYYRIECACLQLMSKETSVTEAGYNCGFNDSSYFIKVFRDTKGITPRHYRETEGLSAVPAAARAGA